MTAQITTLQPPVHPDPHVLQWQLALSALPLSIAASGWSAALEDLLAHRSPWSHLPAPAPRARWLGTMRLPAAPLAAIAAGHAGGARLSWPDATGFATHAIAAKMWTPPEVYGNRVRARRSGFPFDFRAASDSVCARSKGLAFALTVPRAAKRVRSCSTHCDADGTLSLTVHRAPQRASPFHRTALGSETAAHLTT